MIVEQIWTANAGRNFNYLIACAETGEYNSGRGITKTSTKNTPL